MSPQGFLFLLFRSIAVVALPFVIYFALQHFEARAVGLILLTFLLLRSPRKITKWLISQGWLAVPLVTVIAIGVIALWMSNDPVWVLAYPVAMSGIMLVIFAGSLMRPPSVVERIARLKIPNLPPEGVRYTRRVTQVWCGFFVINGSIAAWTALAGSREAWVLYNGLISYILMGAIFAGEWIYRQVQHGSQLNNPTS